MRGLSSLPLDDDLIDRVLTFCPSFSALQAAILVSKDFHRVFQLHPRSIMRAVAYNVVGPALPSALRVIRYPYPNISDDAPDDALRQLAGLNPLELANACPEAHEPSILTAQEKQQLMEHADVLSRFEAIYSMTSKDRTSQVSVLSIDESFILRRAAYRVMLFCKLFCLDHFEDDQLEDLDPDLVANIIKQRTAVLNAYDSEELREIHSLVKFMKEVFDSVAAYNQDSIVDEALGALLSCGPEGLVRTWEDRNFDFVREHGDQLLDWGEPHPLFADDYFSRPMENIWNKRGDKKPKEEEPCSMYILDEVVGANDTCSQCPAPGGLKLLNRANWHRMQIYPLQLLRGKLKINPVLSAPYNQATAHLTDSDLMGEWIEAVWSHKNVTPSAFLSTTDDNATEEDDESDSAPAPRMINKYSRDWTGWDVDLSYCTSCLISFLEDHVWRWWASEWPKSGHQTLPADDCWYGYNCNTQTHRPLHAQKLNVPTSFLLLDQTKLTNIPALVRADKRRPLKVRA